MRPRTILMFEGLMLGTLVVGWLQLALSWTRQVPNLARITQHPITMLLAMMTVMTAIYLALTLLVSRRRSRIAAGVLIVLFAFGIPAFVRTITAGSPTGYTVLADIQIVGQFVALILLFLPSARAWFRRDDAKPDLRETFS